MKLIATLTLVLWLFSCSSSDAVGKRIRIEDPEHHIKDSPDILQFDSVLYTGWYFVSDIPTGYKRQNIKSGNSYNIEPVPIVTATNFDNVSLFHEKDCWALYTWLDKKGSQALNTALQKAAGKQLAFILDNKLLRLQPANDPQFANVEDNADRRIHGQVLTFPCNSFSLDELKNYETILKSENGNR